MRSPASLAVRRDLGFWAVVLAGLLILLWLFSEILLPFVLGMAIAYVVDPLVVWLGRRGLSRGAAAGILIAGSFLAGVGALLLVGPIVFEQAGRFIDRLPELLGALYRVAVPPVERLLARLGGGPRGEVPAVLAEAVHRLESMVAGRAAALFGRSLALVNLVGLLSVTPLVAFYLLRDWPKIIGAIDGWLPRGYAPIIRAQAREADRVLAGFARGAALVCALLGVFYALALTLVGLDFGLLIGLVAGALSFVPFLGTFVGFGSAVGMAIIQFWPEWQRVAVVAALFLGGNFVADYVVTPRLVGDRIGVHPLWILFGVFAGGALFGFVGVLIAVPACALIGVVARFAIAQYEASTYYRGIDDDTG
jgi:predicted PurR-regulated permease PerM